MSTDIIRWNRGPSSGFVFRHFINPYNDKRTICGVQIPSKKPIKLNDGPIECQNCLEEQGKFIDADS